MKAEGRILTDIERADVRAPFSKNDGIAWDIKIVGDYIKKGADRIKEEKSLSEAITNGLKMLKGK